MHCVTQAPRPLLCPDLDKWPPRDDDGPPCIGLSEDGTGVRLSNYQPPHSLFSSYLQADREKLVCTPKATLRSKKPKKAIKALDTALQRQQQQWRRQVCYHASDVHVMGTIVTAIV